MSEFTFFCFYSNLRDTEWIRKISSSNNNYLHSQKGQWGLSGFSFFFFIIANSFLLSSVFVNYIANPSLLSATDIGTIKWLTTIEH